MPRVTPNIFRAYDIRGRAGTEISEEACRLIGQAFGEILAERYAVKSPHVILGRDARTHSPLFEKAMMEGLLAAGCRIELIGPTPSPLNYFTLCARKADGSVQITASHNPGHDNGIKLQARNAESFAGEDIQMLRKRIETLTPTLSRNVGEGGRAAAGEGEIDAVSPYIEHLSRIFPDTGKGMRVVVDGGNGIAGPVNCKMLRAAGCDVSELFTEPDGTFPNHPADPSKHETLRDLQKTVTEKKAQIGIAFDGDGDRLGIVDENGTVRTADEILLLLAKDHLSRFPGSPVVFTVSNSSILESEIRKWGGKPVMCKVGHSHVEHAMRGSGAKLGGEQSGHFFCGENYFGFDDALVAALHVHRIAQAACKPFSELFSDFPKVYQAPERRPACPDDRKVEIVKELSEQFAKHYSVNTLDGARVDFGDGAWAGIRFSNTSPCLSICIEARSAEKLKEVEKIVLNELRKYPEVEL